MSWNYFYLLTIRFDGTDYCGWQIQPKDKTIQGEVEVILKQIKIGEFHLTGSGRTDAGVHGHHFMIRLRTINELDQRKVENSLNGILPSSIKVLKLEKKEADFAITSEGLRTYRYLFTNFKKEDPLTCRFMANNPMNLDFKLMQEAAQAFVGEHDFKSFHSLGSDPISTVRTISKITLESREFNQEYFLLPEHYMFEVTGNGFLKQMVRYLVGALWAVGEGKITAEEIKEQLSQPSKKICAVSPARGLYKF